LTLEVLHRVLLDPGCSLAHIAEHKRLAFERTADLVALNARRR
jgi:hypothetical protein